MPLADADIDQEMASDWKAITEKYAVPDEPAEPEAAIAAKDVPRETSEKPAIEKARDEAGKFVKAEAEKPAKVIEKIASTKKEVLATDMPVKEAQAAVSHADQHSERDTNRPPSTWKPQVRGEWDKLPPTVRAEIHRREADFQNGQSQLLPDARLGNAMRGVTEPYRAIIEQSYGTPDRAMQAFLQSAGTLQLGNPQQKLAEIVRISQQFGIDLNQLSGQSQPQTPQQPFADPRVDQLLHNMQRQEQQRQTNEQRQLETMATAWMNEADAQGNPLRPYLGDVMQEMSVLIPQIKTEKPQLTHAQVLEQAYDRAVWANPDTRTALQGQQQSELLERQRTENQARVSEAKKAASVNVTRRGSTPSPAKPGSMEDTLRDTARTLGLIS